MAEQFDNAAALAKLALLNPAPAELAAAAAPKANGTAVSGKQGKRTTAGTGSQIGAGRIGTAFEPKANPAWVQKRIDVLAEVQKRNAEAIAAIPKPPITITLPDGKTMAGNAWVTSPLDIATQISKGLANAVCISSVRHSTREPSWASNVVNADREDDGDAGDAASEWEYWDLTRPLEGDCDLRLHKWDEPAGKETFWHSSAHILGEALEMLFGAQLTHGPPLESGFFYDSYLGGEPFRPTMNDDVEKRFKKICDEKQVFERVVVTKEDVLQLFEHNPFKLAIINAKIPDGATTTVYKNGPFIDLCRGPHLPHTGKVKAFAVTKTSAALWLGKVGNDELQRVYGITFPDKNEFKEWKHFQEEAAKRDHRVIGLNQELFFFDDLSPGSCFFQPLGGRIYGRLMEVIREQYWLREYDEVITPNMYNMNLWNTSGHAAKYKENMFLLDIEGAEFGLKPMNCPGHCIMFKHRKRSYRELPLRFADFGVLHRNELSGALTGLTRVRRFQQDDAHIFCTIAQIKDEVMNVLDFIATVYSYLGMDFALKLSTRPETALGDAAVWDKAEDALTDALNEFKAKTNRPWSLNPGDGAFYGPKIDVQVFDALRRPHQCATVQLDFVQPERFDLKYMSSGGDKEGYERPVMIHRAIMGSFERMIAILTEHYAGKWPLFLSPRQVQIIPVSPKFTDYARSVQRRVRAAGFYVDCDLSARTLNKMVREAQLAQYNFILVVGSSEEEADSVNVRTRDNEVHGSKTVSDFVAELKDRVAKHE